MFRPGELDQLIRFESESDAPDNQGGQTVTWVAFPKDTWAKAKPMTGSERDNFDQLENPSTYTFVVRNRFDITEKHRIEWNGQYYNIRSIPTRGKRDLYLQIVAERGVTQ